MSRYWLLDSIEKLDNFNEHIKLEWVRGNKPRVQFASAAENPKTPSQVRYAHSLCQALADHYDRPLETAKKDAKVAYGVIKVSTSLVTGDRAARLVSFADYKKKEMEAFLLAMEAHLSEKGIPFVQAKP